MKQNVCWNKRAALLTGPIIVLLLLPSLITAWSSQQNFPVSHAVSLSEKEIRFVPKNGWAIQQVSLEEDGEMVPVKRIDSRRAAVSASFREEPECIQLICRREENGTTVERNVIYSVLRERDGSVAVKACQEGAGESSFSYIYPHPADPA